MIRFLATSLCSLVLLLPTLASAQQKPELVGSVVAPPLGAPGQLTSISVLVRNTGAGAAGTFDVEFYLSEDRVWDIADQLIHARQVTLDGVDCNVLVNERPPDGCAWPPFPPAGSGVANPDPVEFVLPTQITAGTPGNENFYIILRVDPDNVVEEAVSEANDAVSSGTIRITSPDLFIAEGVLQVEWEHGGCFFGEDVTLTYSICNQGGGHAWAYSDFFYLTDLPPEESNPQKDFVIATVPQSCRTSGSAECGGRGECDKGVCHMYCDTDADCDPGMVCAEDATLPITVGKTCQNYVAPMTVTDCPVFTRTITLPERDASGNLLAERYYDLYLYTITSEAYSEDPGLRSNNRSEKISVFCRQPRPDFAVSELLVPSRVAAGETATIVRTFANVGIRPGTAKYRYVLSVNEFPSTDDVLIPIESTGGEGEVSLDAFTDGEAADVVRIPSFVKEGEYYFGVVVDPGNRVLELDKANNRFVAASRIRVDRAPLSILTRSLPPAIVGTYYTYQFVAVGGIATYQWSADPMPAGFTLDADGTFSGTAPAAGIFPFTVSVRSGDLVVKEKVVLQVFDPVGPLTITTTELPNARVNVDYSARIAVQGGVPPYVCELDPATAINVPSAIVLNSNCELTGEVVDLPGAPQNQPFVVRVRDQLGSVAERSYTIRLVRGSAVTIETDRMDEAVAGMSYGNPSTGERPEKDNAGCVTARGGDQVYTWMLEGFSGRRRVPAGLSAQPVPIAEGRKIDGVTVQTMFCFSGTPTECGEFLLPVRVTDGDGQTDYADVPLNVRCAEIELTTRELAAVEANATVDVQLQAKPAEGVHFRLVGGRLPAGLELASDGRLHGTVAENAAAGVYSFLVDMKNDVGGRGRAPLSIEVKPTKKELKKIPPEREKIGCGSSVAGNGLSGIAPFAVVLLGLMAAALRRRVAATARVGVRMLGGWGARPRG